MSLYNPVSSNGDAGTAGMRIVDIGNTGTGGQEFNCKEGQPETAVMQQGGNKFVLAVPDGQPATAGQFICVCISAPPRKNAVCAKCKYKT